MNPAEPSQSDPAAVPQLAPPKPRVTHSRWPYPLIWLIPVLAAVAAGAYWYRAHQEKGAVITVELKDGSGLKPGQTLVSHLGVVIGKVVAVDLTSDHKFVEAKIQLQDNASAFATKGSVYWVVRPQISVTSIQGLDAITTGPYIEANAGTGGPADRFSGLDEPPASQGAGLHIILHALRVERAQPDAPVYFRGVQVGVIQKIQLNSDATGIDEICFIYERYAPLVRIGSKFWVVKGIDLQGGLFSGVQMKFDSIKSVISGGISFATPEEANVAAPNGMLFTLEDEPKKEWMNWSPQIRIGDDTDEGKRNPVGMPQPSQAVRSMVGNK